MPDPGELLKQAPQRSFSGTVYRICVSRYRTQMLSVRGSLLFEGRYNVRSQFGVLYTSTEENTARAEIQRYYTVEPKDGFALAEIEVRLGRVADLTDVGEPELTGRDHTFCQAVGQIAWESGVEALLVPSAAFPDRKNLAILIDNQHPGWRLGLASLTPS